MYIYIHIYIYPFIYIHIYIYSSIPGHRSCQIETAVWKLINSKEWLRHHYSYFMRIRLIGVDVESQSMKSNEE